LSVLQLPFKTGIGSIDNPSNFPSKLAPFSLDYPPTSLQNWPVQTCISLQLPFKTGGVPHGVTSNFPSKLAFNDQRLPPTSLQNWPTRSHGASNFPSKLAEAGISVYAETRFFYLKYLN